MNASPRMMNYNYLESRYYRFFADKHFSFSLDRFAAVADERLEKMEHFFGIKQKNLSNKAFYFIECARENGRNCGRAFADDRIVCFFDDTQDPSCLLLPFVHEEAHLMSARLFGFLPSFWNEGIAERMVVFLNADRWGKKQLKILETNIALSERMMSTLGNMSWTMNDALYQRYRRRYVTGYVFAALTVDYLINTYGKEKFISYMCELSQEKNGLCDFLRREHVLLAVLNDGRRLILQENG